MIALAWPFIALCAIGAAFAFGWRWASVGARYSADVRQLTTASEAFHAAATKLDSRVCELELIVRKYENE